MSYCEKEEWNNEVDKILDDWSKHPMKKIIEEFMIETERVPRWEMKNWGWAGWNPSFKGKSVLKKMREIIYHRGYSAAALNGLIEDAVNKFREAKWLRKIIYDRWNREPEPVEYVPKVNSGKIPALEETMWWASSGEED